MLCFDNTPKDMRFLVVAFLLVNRLSHFSVLRVCVWYVKRKVCKQTSGAFDSRWRSLHHSGNKFHQCQVPAKRICRHSSTATAVIIWESKIMPWNLCFDTAPNVIWNQSQTIKKKLHYKFKVYRAVHVRPPHSPVFPLPLLFMFIRPRPPEYPSILKAQYQILQSADVIHPLLHVYRWVGSLVSQSVFP